MSGTAFSYRLPSEDEVKRILKEAAGKKGSQTIEGKAKSNLLRSLDWAYGGMIQETRNKVAYKGTTALGTALANKETISDQDVLQMRQSLIDASQQLQHPGNTLSALDENQKKALKLVIGWFRDIVPEIELKKHDEHVETIFPADEDMKQTLDDRRAEVVKRLKRAYECIRLLFTTGKIVVAGYHPYVKSGGGGGPTSVDLKPEFFGSYTDKERRATLVHEATHTITEVDMRTADHCYIHQLRFIKVPLKVRYMNASHFEALIRLINGETLNLAKDEGSTNGTQSIKLPVKEHVTEILTSAWVQAWRWHGDLAKKHQTASTKINVERKWGSVDLIDQAHVLGLSWAKVEKGYLSTDVNISNSDLAFLENRAGKLGVLMGSSVVDKAAEQVTEKKGLKYTKEELEETKLQVTKVEKLLEKVIELEGALRKTSNNKKTLDMIMALAEKKIEAENNTSIKKLVEGRYDLFLKTYPRKK